MISGKDKIFHRLVGLLRLPTIHSPVSILSHTSYISGQVYPHHQQLWWVLSLSSHNKKLVGKLAVAQYLRGWSDEAVAGLVVVVRSAEWRLPLCPWLHQPAPRPVALHSSPTPRGKEQQWWRSCAFRESITVPDIRVVQWSPWDVGIVLFQIKVKC